MLAGMSLDDVCVSNGVHRSHKDIWGDIQLQYAGYSRYLCGSKEINVISCHKDKAPLDILVYGHYSDVTHMCLIDRCWRGGLLERARQQQQRQRVLVLPSQPARRDLQPCQRLVRGDWQQSSLAHTFTPASVLRLVYQVIARGQHHRGRGAFRSCHRSV